MNEKDKPAMAEMWKEFHIKGLARAIGEDKISKIFGVCQKCNKAQIRNYAYTYCPECMNEFYIESGYPPFEWVKNVSGILVGKS